MNKKTPKLKFLLIKAFVLLVMLISFSQLKSQDKSPGTESNFPFLAGPYLGQKPPGMKPEIFAPGIVSTDLHDDFGPAFTPDGKEMFFRCIGAGKMIILYTHLKSGVWTYPEIAPFSGPYNDFGVFISQDGNRLFFSSDRPIDNHDTTRNLDIFAVDRLEEGWGVPYSVLKERSGSEDRFACSIDSEGTIYYFMKDNEGVGGFDLYQLKLGDSVYSTSQLLDGPLNTRHDETSPCIARDGSYIVYFSDKGPTGKEGARLYVSFLSEETHWTQPVNLSEFMGMTLPGKHPTLSPDGEYLFFVVPESEEANRRLGRLWELDVFHTAIARYGGGNVYWVKTSVIEALKQKVITE